MILTCSKCATQFTVSAAALGTRGRKVKCSRCAHTWHQEPETAPGNDASPAAPSSLSPPSPLATPSPLESALDREPVVSPAFAAAPAAVVKKQAGAVLKLSTVFFILLMVASGALVALPKIKLPQAAMIKEAIGMSDTSGFVFQKIDFKTVPTATPGKMKLVFTGAVQNTTTLPRAIPPVTVILYDRAGREVRSLEYQFPVAQLEGGKTTPFEPKMNNIPDSLSRVVLDFGNNVDQLLR